MKVFISWSGELSHRVAQLLGGWIEEVLQDVQKWLSSADIDKGSLWFGEIADHLKATSVGILCLTAENLSAPWILFEAGALSKGLSKNRVPVLSKRRSQGLETTAFLFQWHAGNQGGYAQTYQDYQRSKWRKGTFERAG